MKSLILKRSILTASIMAAFPVPAIPVWAQRAQETQVWEAMKKHMYVVADALAGAIAKQFPAKFS